MRERLRALRSRLSFKPKLERHDGENVMLVENQPVCFPASGDAEFFVACYESVEALCDEIDGLETRVRELTGVRVDELLARVLALEVALEEARQENDRVNAQLVTEVRARTEANQRAARLARVVLRGISPAKRTSVP